MKVSSIRRCSGAIVWSILITSRTASSFVKASVSSRVSRTSLQRLWDQTDGNIPNILDEDSTGSSSSPSAESKASTIFSDSEETSSQASILGLSSSSPQFGDVVPLQRREGSASNNGSDVGMPDSLSYLGGSESQISSASSSTVAAALDPAAVKRRNFGVAILSVGLAVTNFIWQYLHPITPIQILYQMEQQSSPITVIGTTNKPTVVDFWAPWCENCKLLAPTLLQIEEEYGKDVNFVVINGDQPAAWPLIEAFGVDAIPHLALVEADGTVDTALIGRVPKQWLEQDLQVLVKNAAVSSSTASSADSSTTKSSTTPLPYQMLDVFANRPEQRRIQIQNVPMDSQR